MFKNFGSTIFGMFKSIMAGQEKGNNVEPISFEKGSAKIIGVTKPSFLARLVPSNLDQRPLKYQLTEWLDSFVGNKLITVFLPWAVKSSVRCLKFIPTGYRNAVAVTGGLFIFFSKFSQFLSPSTIAASQTPIPQEVKHVIMHQIQDRGLEQVTTKLRQTIDQVTGDVSLPHHFPPSLPVPHPSTLPNVQHPSPEQIIALGQELMDKAPAHSNWYYIGWGLFIAGTIATGGYAGYQVYQYYFWAKANLFPFLFALGMVGGFNPEMSVMSGFLTGMTTLGLLNKMDLPKDYLEKIKLPDSANLKQYQQLPNYGSEEETLLLDQTGTVRNYDISNVIASPDSGPGDPTLEPLLSKYLKDGPMDLTLIDLSEFEEMAPPLPLLEPVEDSAITAMNEVAEGFRVMLMNNF